MKVEKMMQRLPYQATFVDRQNAALNVTSRPLQNFGALVTVHNIDIPPFETHFLAYKCIRTSLKSGGGKLLSQTFKGESSVKTKPSIAGVRNTALALKTRINSKIEKKEPNDFHHIKSLNVKVTYIGNPYCFYVLPNSCETEMQNWNTLACVENRVGDIQRCGTYFVYVSVDMSVFRGRVLNLDKGRKTVEVFLIDYGRKLTVKMDR